MTSHRRTFLARKVLARNLSHDMLAYRVIQWTHRQISIAVQTLLQTVIYAVSSQLDEGCDAEEGDLKLVGRMDVNVYATGAVQVFQDGAFVAVCKTCFDAVAANVACRQLGFMSGTVSPLAQRGRQSPEELKL